MTAVKPTNTGCTQAARALPLCIVWSHGGEISAAASANLQKMDVKQSTPCTVAAPEDTGSNNFVAFRTGFADAPNRQVALGWKWSYVTLQIFSFKCIYVCLSACLSICMSVCLSVWISVCLYSYTDRQIYKHTLCQYVCLSVKQTVKLTDTVRQKDRQTQTVRHTYR